MNQWELSSNTCDQRKARENAGGQVAMGFGIWFVEEVVGVY